MNWIESNWNVCTTTGWMVWLTDGWMDVKAGLRIGNNNEIHCRKIDVEKNTQTVKE